jgi:hypothetical protein
VVKTIVVTAVFEVQFEKRLTDEQVARLIRGEGVDQFVDESDACVSSRGHRRYLRDGVGLRRRQSTQGSCKVNAWTESVKQRIAADAALQKLPAKKLVGHVVRLRHAIETRGGDRFRKGLRMRVYGTWRGRFHHAGQPDIRHVDRGSFEVIA